MTLMQHRVVFELAVIFASEAESQLFLACSKFLGKFEPRCSYKIVLIKKARSLKIFRYVEHCVPL